MSTQGKAKRILALDFDGVIHDTQSIAPGKRMGEPVLGAADSIDTLKRAGNKIVIFTARARLPYLEDWLHKYDIYYDEITDIKPDADYFIGNHALPFHSWAQICRELGVYDD